MRVSFGRVGFAATLCLGLRTAALLASAVGWGAPVQGAGAPLTPLSLTDARRAAFERNWDLLAARSGVETAVAQRVVAREFPNPQLALSTGQINVNGAGNATARGDGVWQRSYATFVTVNQLIEIGGKRSSRRESAEAGVAAAEARLLDARRVLDNAVTQSYVAAALAGAKASILRDSAASLRREAGIAAKRFSAGDISRADQMQIEIAAERLELDATAAEADALNARVAVDVLRAEPVANGQWAPADSLQDLARGLADGLPATAAAERPDLRAAKADVARAEADLRLQRAQRVPDPTLMVQYQHQPPDFAESVGVGVSLPLPLWQHNGGAIQAARVARDQALRQQRRAEAQVAAEEAGALRTYTIASEKLHRHSEQILPKSAEVRRTVAFAYEGGGASLLELLAAERSDNDARLENAQAAADVATALSALRSARAVTSAENSAAR